MVLKCRPPDGSPQPNITWYKIGKPSLLLGHDGSRRIRLTSKKNLVIKRFQIGDSGEYQCVATNMAARRAGPVMKLDVGGLSFVGKLLRNTKIPLPRIVPGQEAKGAFIGLVSSQNFYVVLSSPVKVLIAGDLEKPKHKGLPQGREIFCLRFATAAQRK